MPLKHKKLKDEKVRKISYHRGTIKFYFSNKFTLKKDWEDRKERNFFINQYRNCMYYDITFKPESIKGAFKLINSKGEIFDSVSKAALAYKIPSGTLCCYLRGENPNKTDLKYYDEIHKSASRTDANEAAKSGRTTNSIPYSIKQLQFSS